MRAPMLSLCVVWALGCGSPASAQDAYGLTLQRDAELRAQADLARQREVELNNRLSTLEARQQTEQALRDIEALRRRPTLPGYHPAAPAPSAEPPGFAAIPDATLAASNARVRAAAANRR